MPIPIPVTRTKIATQSWGIPITNEVNRLTPLVDSNVTRVTALETKTATTAWANVILQNGWVNAGGVQGMQYRKVGDNVQLRGRISSGTAATTMFTLPSTFRPLIGLDLVALIYNGASWAGSQAFVFPDGRVDAPSGTIALLALNTLFSTIS